MRIYISMLLIIFFSGNGAFADNRLIELDGIIEPSMVVKLSSGVEGLVEEVLADRGNIVKKGQIIAILEASVEKANLESAKTKVNNKALIEEKREKLKFLELEKKRIDDLYNKNAVSKREKDQFESNRNIAIWELKEQIEQNEITRLQLNQAKAIYNRKIIRSPLKGIVVERYLSPGEYVENQAILKLAVVDPLYIETIAPIDYINVIKEGMTAEILPEKRLDKDLKGIVKIVDKIVDAASGTFGIRIELSNPKNEILAGLKCKVLIDVNQSGSQKGLVLPK